MKLTAALKQVLDALAAADAGENLSMTQKFHYLNPGAHQTAAPSAGPTRTPGNRKYIALFLGSELPADIIDYVVQTCSRLQHDLLVLTFQSSREAEAMLHPFAGMLADAKIEMEIDVLTGDPVSGLARYLRHHPGIAFLAVNDAGYLGRGLINGTQSPKAFPVPVVLVAARHGAITADSGPDKTTPHTHVA